MRFKLDENFGISMLKIFREAGHDVQTILDEKMGGCPDQTVYEACCNENRCLVTLDLDFSNILRFSPEKCGGIVVIRASLSQEEFVYIKKKQTKLIKRRTAISMREKRFSCPIF